MMKNQNTLYQRHFKHLTQPSTFAIRTYQRTTKNCKRASLFANARNFSLLWNLFETFACNRGADFNSNLYES